MTVNIAIEMITGRILHPFIQLHQFGILCRHIDLDICRNSLTLIREPFDQIPLLDRDSATILGNRKMGSMVDMVSQFEVDDWYSQINYQDQPGEEIQYRSVWRYHSWKSGFM